MKSASLLLAVFSLGCVANPPDPWQLEVVEDGVFRFEGISPEHRRWYQARYQDFSLAFGIRLAPGDRIVVSASSSEPAACMGKRVPGDIEYHPCQITGGYKLVCEGHRQCPMRFAELLANIGVPRSAFLRDGLAEILAGGVTTAGAFDFETEEYEAGVLDLIDDRAYAAELERLYRLDDEDWYQSTALRYSLRRTAARFVALLIARFGASQVPTLLRLAPADWQTPAQLQLGLDFRLAPKTNGRAYARLEVECASPELSLGSDVLIDLGEGAPLYDPMGPLQEHLQARTIEVSEPSVVHLRLADAGKPYFHLQSCATGDSLAHANTGDRLTFLDAKAIVTEDLTLAPGRYVLLLGVRGGDLAGERRVRVQVDLTAVEPVP